MIGLGKNNQFIKISKLFRHTMDTRMNICLLYYQIHFTMQNLHIRVFSRRFLVPCATFLMLGGPTNYHNIKGKPGNISVRTVVFISYRIELRVMLAGATSGIVGDGKRSRFQLMFMLGDFWNGRLVDMLFQIGSGYGQGGIRKFVDYVDGPAFLERKQIGPLV